MSTYIRIHAYIHAYIWTYVCAYIHTYIHTCIHNHACIAMHTLSPNLLLISSLISPWRSTVYKFVLQDIADAAWQTRRRAGRPLDFSVLIADMLFSIVVQTIFLLQVSEFSVMSSSHQYMAWPHQSIIH